MITQEKLKKYLHYNPDSGVFTWVNKTSSKSRVKIGSIAGTLHHDGYIMIALNKKQYGAHRLAWLYTYGTYPNQQIDHINQVRDDNRLENLREVSAKTNTHNRGTSGRNTSGCMGVVWDKRASRWQARINVDGKRIFLGMFTEFSDAVNARKNAEVLYGFHENHGKEI